MQERESTLLESHHFRLPPATVVACESADAGRREGVDARGALRAAEDAAQIRTGSGPSSASAAAPGPAERGGESPSQRPSPSDSGVGENSAHERRAGPSTPPPARPPADRFLLELRSEGPFVLPPLSSKSSIAAPAANARSASGNAIADPREAFSVGAVQSAGRAATSVAALSNSADALPAPAVLWRWNSIEQGSRSQPFLRSNTLEDTIALESRTAPVSPGVARFQTQRGRSLLDLRLEGQHVGAPSSPQGFRGSAQNGLFSSSRSLSPAAQLALARSDSLDFTEYTPQVSGKPQTPPTVLVKKIQPSQAHRASGGGLRPKILGTLERPAFPTPPRLLPYRQGTPANLSGAVSMQSSLSDFKLYDENPRKHRIALASLKIIDKRLREEGALSVMSKDAMFGEKEKTRDAIAAALDSVLESQGALAPNQKNLKAPPRRLTLIGSLLKPKKAKKASAVLLHLLLLAIHDQLPQRACALVDLLSSATLVKKRPREANRAFLMGVALRMENVAMAMFDKGYPMDVNAPIYASGGADGPEGKKKKKKRLQHASTNNITFTFPSFFIVAIGMGMDNLARRMMKRANINQSWFGLTPLILAATRHGIGSASMVKTLLSYGADPHQGLYVEQLSALIRLQQGPGNKIAASKVFTFGGSAEIYGGSSDSRTKPPSSRHQRPSPAYRRPSSSVAKNKCLEEISRATTTQYPARDANIVRGPSAPVVPMSARPAGAAEVIGPVHVDSRRHRPSVSSHRSSVSSHRPSISSNQPSANFSAAGNFEYLEQLDLSLLRAVSGSHRVEDISEICESERKKQANLVDANRRRWMVYPAEFAAAVRNSDCVYLIIERFGVGFPDGMSFFLFCYGGSAAAAPAEIWFVISRPLPHAAPKRRTQRFTDHKPLLNTHFGLLVQDDINITSQLIFAGAPLTQTDTRGSTAFHLAARRGLVELVYLYLMQGIDCDIEGEHRWTVLHEAVSRKRKKVAMILVDAGARLDAQTDNNETPAIVGAKVGLSPEEVKDFFDVSQMCEDDRAVQATVRSYLQALSACTSVPPPLSMFLYPPVEFDVCFRRRADTAPLVRNATAPVRNSRSGSVIRVNRDTYATANARDGGAGAPQSAPKKKGAMERFGFVRFRARTASFNEDPDAAVLPALPDNPAGGDAPGSGKSPSRGKSPSQGKAPFGFRLGFGRKAGGEQRA